MEQSISKNEENKKKLEVLVECILKGNFKEAEDVLVSITEQTYAGCLASIDFNKANMMLYTFACYLIAKDESVDNHLLAVGLLQTIINYFEGAYDSAYYHAKRALELEPDNIVCMQTILCFYKMPDHPIYEEEAVPLALKILEREPDSQGALEVVTHKDAIAFMEKNNLQKPLNLAVLIKKRKEQIGTIV